MRFSCIGVVVAEFNDDGLAGFWNSPLHAIGIGSQANASQANISHLEVGMQSITSELQRWQSLKENAMPVCLKSDMETFAVLRVPEDWNTVHDVEGLDGIPSHYPWQGVVAYRVRPIADLAR